MKKIILCLTIFALLSTNCNVLAEPFSETEKDYFYEEFLKGFFMGVDNYLNYTNIDSNQKQSIKAQIYSNLDKQKLKDRTWSCVSQKDRNDMAGINECMSVWVLTDGQYLMQNLQL